MTIEGACFCGAIRYRSTAPLRNARSCHCSRCRKAFSGAGSAYAEVESEAFAWLTGAEDLAVYETGPDWALGFCRRCGSTLCGLHRGSVHGVTLGSVEGDPGVALDLHIFVGSKAPWDHIGGPAPQYEAGPPDGWPTDNS